LICMLCLVSCAQEIKTLQELSLLAKALCQSTLMLNVVTPSSKLCSYR
jgi:hypothetical protein